MLIQFASKVLQVQVIAPCKQKRKASQKKKYLKVRSESLGLI